MDIPVYGIETGKMLSSQSGNYGGDIIEMKNDGTTYTVENGHVKKLYHRFSDVGNKKLKRMKKKKMKMVKQARKINRR